jgi:hypothetical protein
MFTVNTKHMTNQSLDLSVSWYKESVSSTELGPYHLTLKSEDSKHKALLQNLVEHFRKTRSLVNFLHLLTPCSRALLAKQIIAPLLKKFTSF